MSPSSTPHLLWARPVCQIALFLSLHAYATILPALHSFRLCHQYGNSNSFLLPPLSRLPPSLTTRIEQLLIGAYRRDVLSTWTHRLETASPCPRCLCAPATREDELRKQICHCRKVFRRELELEVRRMFVEKGCGKGVWDAGDGRGKMTTGMFLRRFCGLELFVEGSGEGLWLCLPFQMKGGEEGNGKLCVGRKYMQLVEDAVPRFRFAVETLGMAAGGEEKGQFAERRLEHWREVDDWKGISNADYGVKLMLFSVGYVVA